MVYNYKTSKNYSRLKELLDAGYSVVCFTTYDWRWLELEPHEPMMVTDVCMARLLDKDNKYAHYNISSRGTGFLDYWLHDTNRTTFEEECELQNIEFIEPEIPDEAE